MKAHWLFVALGCSAAAACGGKVAFDGLPASTGSGGTSSHSASSVVVGTTVTSTTSSTDVQVASAVVGVSVGPSTGAGGDSNCGGFQLPNQTCQSCAGAACCAELLACDTGTDCFSLKQCLDSCNADPNSCQQKCGAAFPGGAGDFNALQMCLNGNCPGECGTGGGNGVCDSGLTTSNPTCDQCLTANCCKEADACTGGMMGMNMQQVQKCLQDCQMMPPGPLCAPILDCQKNSCGGCM